MRNSHEKEAAKHLDRALERIGPSEDCFIRQSLAIRVMMSQETHPLKSEYEFYVKNKGSLLEKFAIKFIIIKGEEVLGPFDTDADAYKAGLLKYGAVPFFITRVQKDDEKAITPVLELGLLSAGL